MTLLDLSDIQSGVIFGGGAMVATYLVYDTNALGKLDQERGERLVELLTTARSRPSPPEASINLAFTALGLRRLGLGSSAYGQLPWHFRFGGPEAAERVGDTGASDSKEWDSWARNTDIAAMVTITARRDVDRDAAVGNVIDIMGEPVARQHACALGPGGRKIDQSEPHGQPTARYEHFGFRDGISNPVIEGAGRAVSPGNGALRGGRWYPLKPGEFILGYEDELGHVDLGAALWPYLRNATYVVWRKLEQLVDEFTKTFTVHLPDGDGVDPRATARAMAEVIGRWADGSPLMTTPGTPLASPAPPENGFVYSGDPTGARCPVGAHIRRMHPRDGLDKSDILVNRHRIIRRGMPYDDGDDRRGLIFVCYNADLARQFEFVQKSWFLGAAARDLPGAVDPLAPFVRTRASLYLVQPGILGCRRLLAALPETTSEAV